MEYWYISVKSDQEAALLGHFFMSVIDVERKTKILSETAGSLSENGKS
jgi:hypothetical protein